MTTSTRIASLEADSINAANGATIAPCAAEDAFFRCVDRLEELIEGETLTLRSCAPVDFDSLNLRKTHALLEFTRVARAMPPSISAEAEQRLKVMRAKLTANADILERHLQAMLEITGVIVDSIRSEDSDGTYSVRLTRQR